MPLVTATPSATAGQPRTGSLQQAFADAAARYHVPQSVLLGVAYLESRWDGHHGAPSVTGGYGPMHLTDARTALAGSRTHHSDPTEDPRGDDSRPRKTVRPPASGGLPDEARLPARLKTLRRAAELTGLPAARLRTDPAANIRGGAALLAAEQRRLGLRAGGDPADWYGAVARYSGAQDVRTASGFADDVYDVMRRGETRTTDEGQRVTLPGAPRLSPDTSQARRLGLRAAPAAGQTECPQTVTCQWIPAPYQQFGDNDYGNHDIADRPEDQDINAIVIHDVEGYYDSAVKLVQDPTYVSWHYTIRSSDGLIAQHVRNKDVAWHAGNWYVNSHSIGIEHEGFLTAPDTWYTEAMYRASARLVKYLADEYELPLDRQHIIGHDNVPGTTPATIPGMHTDPGPYWDWAHYFELLGAPFAGTAGADSDMVTIKPDYAKNKPVYTGCTKAGTCAAHGSSAVRLYTSPSLTAPLVKDIGLRPDGGASTTDVNDTGARATTGQRYAVAERRGDWTAIWYLGQKAWFHNPKDQPTAVPTKGLLATPKAGVASIPVYGRAYPEAAAYPANVPVQPITPLPYKLLAGQKYAIGERLTGEYFYAKTFELAPHRVVRGKDVYYEIQVGHRVGYVRAADVVVNAPPDA
ncbi:peptidoglycan recognition family protein [Streptomyces sp. MST-110588]|uniref:peptidoglycan recognition protein family protein n=1 Tax=Streptomyces sp. MST-110588 TaxID=2833628 RepID=UPI001F5E0767|nr:peptidoglycan recognition family protein [Streptomyces sp. MST-110588]